jgi:ferritin-like protein
MTTPLREPNQSLEEALTTSRGRMLRNALVAGGAFVTGGVLLAGIPKLASSAPSRAQDGEILNFLLRLEYLQEAFYAEAVETGGLSGELLEFARVVGEHERAHVQFLERELGGDAAARPTFEFAETTSDPEKFSATAVEVEEMTAAAYIGQGANLTRRLTSDAARICAVEARHAAWIRDFLNQHPAPRAADSARSPAEVDAAVRQLGLVTES